MASFLTELVAVFLGVSVSFWVADYRERRGDRKKGLQALEGIRGDLAAERPAVAWLLKIYRPTAEAGKELYHAWDQLSAISDRAESILTSLHMGAPYSPSRAHYETVKSSGTLGLIDDEALRGRIASVFEQQQEYLRAICRISNDFDFEFYRQLHPHIVFGESSASIDTYVVPGEAATHGPIELPAGEADRLGEDLVVRNALYMSALFRGYFSELLDSYAKSIEDLDTDLDETIRALRPAS